MPSQYLHNLSQAIEAMYGCKAKHLKTSLVHEMSEGQTVWKGNVETFSLSQHATATHAFAWGQKNEAGEINYIAVLNIPPINSPREAVQAAIIKKHKQL